MLNDPQDAHPIQVAFADDEGNWIDDLIEPEEFIAAFDNCIDQALPMAFFPLIETTLELWSQLAREAQANDDMDTYVEIFHIRADWRHALNTVKRRLDATARLRAN